MRPFLLVLLAILASPAAAGAGLNVVATTPDLGALAREVGGDRVEVSVLTKPTEDPHFVDAKPSFIVKLNRADALIEGGADLEVGWLPALLEGARNDALAAGSPGRVVCSRGVQMLEVPANLDRSKGDVHAAGNPHFMTDPENGKVAAHEIAEGFCTLDAASCDTFRANLDRFTRRLDEKLTEWKAVLSSHHGAEIVAYHNTWPYFATRFGLTINLFLEPKPGIPPTPAHLASVIGRIKSNGVRVIIVEPYQNRKTAESVAEQTGATVVDVAQYPGGVEGTDGGYVELIDYLVRAIAQALEAGAARP
ncbi:MAG: zinc ABC transporter substrate-binding protein [Candidatus Schekmanbacteria bacterium]|nr:zinc ABC transporter substrate-binding protein [Candidatus Schekmanbacteria bacterium]